MEQLEAEVLGFNPLISALLLISSLSNQKTDMHLVFSMLLKIFIVKLVSGYYDGLLCVETDFSGYCHYLQLMGLPIDVALMK